MKFISRLLLAFTFAAGLMLEPAEAAERFAFSQARFVKAQAEGKPILVDITAPWCPVCKVQNSVIERDLFKPDFAQYVVLDVDFDSQKEIVRQFNASSQSTLIIFKGKNETARLVGGTDPELITAMLRRGIK